MNLIFILLFATSCLLVVHSAPRRKVSLLSLNPGDVENNWSTFKVSHRKSYKNVTDESKRFLTILNYNRIEKKSCINF